MGLEMTGGILLLGANGQLGQELLQALARLGQVDAFDVPQIDFLQPSALRQTVRASRPRVIVNAAAYTAVDKAETESDTSFAVNAAAPTVLAEEAQAMDAILVHYSTDYVFDGTKPSPYVEDDPTNPLNIYGRSKLAGEVGVRACAKHLTFRTSWVVGARGHNFVKTMLRLAQERDRLRVVADQIGAPTSATLLADVTAEILTKMAGAESGDPRWGLYHLVADGWTSWHGLAVHAIARARAKGVPLKTLPDAVEAIATAQYPTPARRPANSRLNTAKLRNTFSIALADWTAGIDGVLDRLISELHP